MLAMDGAFIRREHDLSKIDFSVLVDDKRLPQNEQTITQVSEILGMMTMLSGEINHALHRMNTDTRETIKKTQDSYVAIKHLVNSARSNQINLTQDTLNQKYEATKQIDKQ